MMRPFSFQREVLSRMASFEVCRPNLHRCHVALAVKTCVSSACWWEILRIKCQSHLKKLIESYRQGCCHDRGNVHCRSCTVRDAVTGLPEQIQSFDSWISKGRTRTRDNKERHTEMWPESVDRTLWSNVKGRS